MTKARLELTESRDNSKHQNAALVEYTPNSNDNGNGRKHEDYATKPKEEKPKPIGFFKLFRFADRTDKILMFIGLMAAMAHGSAIPCMIIVFGDMIDLFVDDAKLREMPKFIELAECFGSAMNMSTDNFREYFSNMAQDMSGGGSGVACGELHGQLREAISAVPSQFNITSIFDNCTAPGPSGVNLVEAACREILAQLLETMSKFSIYYVVIGCGVLVCAYLQTAMWASASSRQAYRMRVRLFSAILRQDMAWFDTHEPAQLSTRLTDDTVSIADGLGDKVSLAVQNLSLCLVSLIVAFVYGWRLTLVLMACSPLMIAVAVLFNKTVQSLTDSEKKAYASAGRIAEEAISNVKTVYAFNRQETECERYMGQLNQVRKTGIRKGISIGSVSGLLWMLIMLLYALAFWYGGRLIREDSLDASTASGDIGRMSPGRMLLVFFCAIIAAFSLGNLLPAGEAVSTARGAAAFLYPLADRVPEIDSSSPAGDKPDISAPVAISLQNVSFHYPSRSNVNVLSGVTLEIPAGRTTAFVGPSGCGKSTVVQLIQRFYDPQHGEVSLNGKNVRSVNIRWLRSHIGMVGQEPVLFDTSIATNIRYGALANIEAESAIGKDNYEADGTLVAQNRVPPLDDNSVQAAARLANAHDFISQLPQGYSTQVGERGAQISGGQKQRVAIARALLAHPQLLLFDEATSALDSHSEAAVQTALQQAVRGGKSDSTAPTSLVIAHRLTTIRHADNIIVMQSGRLVEQGTHDQLMALKGVYHDMWQTQHRRTGSVSSPTRSRAGSKLEVHGGNQDEDSDSDAESDVSSNVDDKERDGDADEDKKNEEDDSKLPPPSMIRLMKLNSAEWPWILLGCICALANGAIQPAFAFIFADLLGVFAKDAEAQEKEIEMYCLIFVAIAGVSFITFFLQSVCFSISGESLTIRVRQLIFAAMLRRPISWFDERVNNTGALTARLATDASAIKGATGIRLAMMVQAIGALGGGLIMALVSSWRLTLLVLAFVPLVAVGGALEVMVASGVAAKDAEALQTASSVSVEAISNIRTVAALCLQPHLCCQYAKALLNPRKTALKRAHLTAVAFGLSQGVVYFAYAACFYYGAYLVNNNYITFVDMFRCFGALVFSATSLGQASSFAPDYGKAKTSASRVFQLIDNKDEDGTYNVPEPNGELQHVSTLPVTTSHADDKIAPNGDVVEFRKVHFSYPTRHGKSEKANGKANSKAGTDDQQKHNEATTNEKEAGATEKGSILCDFSLRIESGESLALVGRSGCGKSTVVQLIERFYSPNLGEILINGDDISMVNVRTLRRRLGLVGQEPALFDRTIAENIAYGDSQGRPPANVPFDEIVAAAQLANAHDFIIALPDGYSTMVGERGAQLSGGQKQRVAIARALLAKPKLLLLDEATSALDSHSEEIIQDALRQSSLPPMTRLVIAHRLTTIDRWGVDKVAVLHRTGQLTGPPAPPKELLNPSNPEGRHYRRLVRRQMEHRSDNASA